MKQKKIVTMGLALALIAFGGGVAFGYHISNRIGVITRPDIHGQPIKVKEVKITKITANKTANEYPPESGGSIDSLIDGRPETWWYAPLKDNQGVSLDLEISKPAEITEVGLDFMDRYAIDFTIYFQSKDRWVTAKEVAGNQEQRMQILIDPERVISTSKMRITFFRSVAADHLISIKELRLFRKP